jgi:serine/threonine protein kinase/Flp pilus assembly protein TadD
MTIECPRCKSENADSAHFCSNCATPLPQKEEVVHTKTLETQTQELKRGSVFAGRYEIIEELGKGGMGRVYRVEDIKAKEEIALKLVKPEIAADKKTIERFRNELTTARKIAHRNVCRMFDLGEEKGQHFITMEYVSGGDLKKLIRRTRRLDTGTAISIAKQICEGLEEAHRLGIVHRDLKPNNIMIDNDGSARIMDFGIARTVKGKGITGSGVMIGTPEYMSPEQVEGKDVDLRSDIYSLGIVLYEMLTGSLPFAGDTPFTIGVKHKSEIPKDPRELNPQIPGDLSRVILKCLEKERNRRYQSSSEVRSELERIEQGLPTTDRVIPKKKTLTSQEITVQFSMKKIFIPAFAVIAVAIIGLILWSPWSRKPAAPAPSDKPSLAIVYFENNTGDESLDHWRKAIAELLITDLSQSKYVRVLSRDRLYNILSQTNLLEAKSYSSEDLKKIADRGGANFILQGGYAKAENTFRINYALQNISSNELISSDSLEGESLTSIFSMVDELTFRIKSDLRLSQQELASDFDESIETITTGSPEAYRYFSEGMSSEFAGDLPEAIKLYEKAIEIDPGFALSYNFLAWALATLGYSYEVKEYFEKSFELRNRVSEREKYLIEGDYYYYFEVFDKAVEAYLKLLEIYPDDWAGNLDLGVVYRDTEQWDLAIERFEFLKQMKDDSPYTYTNLCVVYRAKGLYDKSRETLEYYLAHFGENDWITLHSARNFLCQGELELALAEAEKALSSDPADYDNIRSRGSINLFRGDLKAAENDFNRLIESAEDIYHLQGISNLALLDLLQGRLEQAKKRIDQGIKKAEQMGDAGWTAGLLRLRAYINSNSGRFEEALKEIDRAEKIYLEEWGVRRSWMLYSKGFIYLALGSVDDAQKTGEELRELTEKDMNKNLKRWYDILAGLIEQKRGNFSGAIDYFQKAVSLLPNQRTLGGESHALFIDSLAFAYYRAGDLDKAREEYEKILSLTTGRYGYGDIYAKSFYMIGKIHEQQGETVRAIDQYEKFLDLWKDADPGLPEVEDAKNRLVGLKRD